MGSARGSEETWRRIREKVRQARAPQEAAGAGTSPRGAELPGRSAGSLPGAEREGSEGEVYGPRRGDLIVLGPAFPVDLEWLVLEASAEVPGPLLAVPADQNPALGPADLEVPIRGGVERLSLRCCLATAIPGSFGEAAVPTGSLEAGDLERVEAKVSEIARTGPPPGALGLDGGPDPELAAWLEEIAEAVEEAFGGGEGEGDAARRRTPPASGPMGPVIPRRTAAVPLRAAAAPLLAAAALLLALGLAFAVFQVRDARSGENAAQRRTAALEGRIQTLEEREEGWLRAEESWSRERQESLGELERLRALNDELRKLPRPPVVPEALLNVAHLQFNLGELRGPEEKVRLPPGAPFILLYFYVGGIEAFDEYALTLRELPSGRLAFEERGLRKLAADNLSAVVPRRLLGGGEAGWVDTEVKVYGLDGARRKEIGSFVLMAAGETTAPPDRP